MCVHLKKLHETLPPVIDLREESDPDITDGQLLYGPDAYDEFIDNNNAAEDLTAELRHTRIMLARLKIRRNVTRDIKAVAIREKAKIECVDLTTFTFSELCSKVPLLRLSTEREFYKSYIEHYNSRVNASRADYNAIITDLEVRISDIEDRQDFLYHNYNL